MLKSLLFALLVMGAMTALILTFPLNKTNSCAVETPQLKQTDDDLEAYTEFTSLSMSERRMAYGQLSPKRKSFFWRRHLITRLKKHPNLTQEQRNLILEASSFATPEWFQTPIETSEWETKVGDPLKSFDRKVRSVFSSKDGAETCAQIGESDSFDGGTPTCSCSTVSDWCWYGSSCNGGGCMWTDGCGTFGWYGCTGSCKKSSAEEIQ